MRMRWSALLVSLIGVCGPAHAMTIDVPVSEALLGTTVTTPVDVGFSGLNGLALDGNLIAADFQFEDDVLLRVQTSGQELSIILTIFTNAPSFPGFATPISGSALYGLEHSHGAGSVPGSAMSSNGSFSMGVFPLITAPTHLSGARFEFLMPTSGYTVTGAALRFTPPANTTLMFGTAAQLPEPSTGVLTAIGLLALALKRRAGGRRTNSQSHHKAAARRAA